MPSCCKVARIGFASLDAKHCELIHMDSERQTARRFEALGVPSMTRDNQQARKNETEAPPKATLPFVRQRPSSYFTMTLPVMPG